MRKEVLGLMRDSDDDYEDSRDDMEMDVYVKCKVVMLELVEFVVCMGLFMKFELDVEDWV